LKFWPVNGAFDSKGALLVAGVGRGLREGRIAKLTPDLRLAWDHRFDRPGYDAARAVVAGADDRVCVGGETETVALDGPDSHHGEGYATDVWIRCYTSAGKLLWSRQYTAEDTTDVSKRYTEDHTIDDMAFLPDD